ncbi:flagellar assembly protein FliH [Buchnera aphidicola]|jgi:flagellar assembly protein FliH|uniref:Flagellar assembly protein FliH n=1 Tax=Buchnera aphidicola subsp. Schizaphis graminum (strain Sg) TaxID=198804 RepID=FLIH_BUCAP|nr:flagellar assembly protein FliH [Buchnera aphidicola]Q8KA43.1 RecName: Full=Flagellar assembly protein FliH [Buchnera aphidicola str. Sg (Schizaphis graminum)]AAM67639.1 flagellar assembly protein FliH [Buchnera aphidicola str. Sg (Schizaphis graminum)]AWI49864.1 flagellar assembly protein FliH [Buchnera aphidicola (Schizaphis graminum)]
MSNIDVKQNWKRWYPEEIFLKNSKNKKKYFWNLYKLTQQDFFTNNENKKNSNKLKKTDELKDYPSKEEAYNLAFKSGIEKKEEKKILFNDNLNKLLSNFEAAISLFDQMLFTRLLKTILIISSYIVGKNIKMDELILLKNVKKIINNDSFFLKKKQLIIHPNNKKFLEKIIKNSVYSDKWELCYDVNIDINGCKIRSENGDIDNTIEARWKELCRLVSEEC